MPIPTLIIPIGIPGSGKSRWARERNLRVVSTDEIRLELFGSLVSANSPEVQAANNAQVFAQFHSTLALALACGQTVVADATNLSAMSRSTLRNLARPDGNTRAVVFDRVASAVKWNRQREEDRIVPDDVMDRMIAQFLVAREAVQGEPYTLGHITLN